MNPSMELTHKSTVKVDSVLDLGSRKQGLEWFPECASLNGGPENTLMASEQEEELE